MTSITYRPRVFLDVQAGTEPIGRLVLELFTDKAPKTCENFRSICTSSYTPPGDSKPLTYKLSPFHRIIDEFMIQGGDITSGDGTGGQSIYGEEFEDENLGWREIDKDGLLCMANRGKETNSSQFFITLAPCQHLNAKYTIFGHVVAGMEVVKKIAKVKVDKNDRPQEVILVSQCGELERIKKPTSHIQPLSQKSDVNGSSDRGRKRDLASRSRSRTLSRSPNRSYDHRKYRKQDAQADFKNRSTTGRRRSDVQLDENRRGRTLTRSPSPTVSKLNPKSSPIPPNHRRKRSPSRSRPRSPTRKSLSPRLRRRRTRSRSRSQSRSWSRHRRVSREARKRHRSSQGRREGGKENWNNANQEDYNGGYVPYRDHARRGETDRYRGSEGSRGNARLGYANGSGDNAASGEVKFKGRGSMKYKDKKW